MTPQTHQTTIEDRNFYHLTWDIAWFGIAWVTITRFLGVYALQVGASPTELAWITAGPPIGMVIASILSVWWRRRFTDSIRAIWLPTLLFRFSFLLLALTPLFPIQWQPVWLVIAVTLPSLPQGVSNILFMGVLKESTPVHRMTPLLGRRTLTVNLSLGLAALVFGLWLEQIAYPLNYALMFGAAFVAALLSQWHLMRVQALEPAPMPRRSGISPFAPLGEVNFLSVIFASVVAHVAFFAVAPVMVMRLVDELGATEGFMAVFSVIELAAGALVALFLSKMVRRMGNRGMVGLAMLVTSVAALVAAWASSLPLILLAAVFTGAGWSTAEIGLIGYFSDQTPTKDTAPYTRIYSQIVWSALFIAPFIGTTLVEIGVSLSAILLVGMGIRIAAALFIMEVLPLRPRRRPTPKLRSTRG